MTSGFTPNEQVTTFSWKTLPPFPKSAQPNSSVRNDAASSLASPPLPTSPTVTDGRYATGPSPANNLPAPPSSISITCTRTAPPHRSGLHGGNSSTRPTATPRSTPWTPHSDPGTTDEFNKYGIR
jgi:hypothetical protein